MKPPHKAKLYISEDGFFRAELWEVHEEIIWEDKKFTLQGIDDDDDYVYLMEQS